MCATIVLVHAKVKFVGGFGCHPFLNLLTIYFASSHLWHFYYCKPIICLDRFTVHMFSLCVRVENWPVYVAVTKIG